MQGTDVLYPTRPLECFSKMKELRRKVAWDTWNSRDNGRPLALSGEVGATAILGAFDAEVLPSMPTGREMRDLDWVVKLNEAAETKGYGRDCCATLRIALGAHFLGTFGLIPGKEERLVPDVVFSLALCQGQMKAHQSYADHMGISTVHIELPYSHPRPAELTDYFLSQCHDAIERLEKAFGRPCDDEKLIEGVRNEWRSRLAMARIAEAQKVVPAPLKLKNFISFVVFAWRGWNHRPEAADFYEMALAEVEERVREGIAGFGGEKVRLLHEGTLPWFSNQVLRYPEKYSGTYVASWTHFTNSGAFYQNDEGHWQVPPAPWERGLELKDRDSALRALAELYLPYLMNNFVMERPEHRLSLAQDWNIDGAVYALDRGCIGMVTVQLESVLLFKEAGIPVVSYEMCCTNPADFDEGYYQTSIDAFMDRWR
ncbi:MAG: 2-hydroxyacyl-CoA dehydratase family protein [Dehalococcoidia bacterium]